MNDEKDNDIKLFVSFLNILLALLAITVLIDWVFDLL